MDDLISRRVAIDAIVNRTVTVDTDAQWLSGHAKCELEIIDVINALPSAQPEIIACGDCKHRYVDGDNVRFNICELHHNKVQSDDWYCADAERRTDE